MTDDTELPACNGTHANSDPTAETEIPADTLDLFTPDEESALPLLLDPREFESGSKRGPGRPPGSTNKKDQVLIQYLMGKGYRSPLEAGAALFNMPTEALSEKIAQIRRKQREKHIENIKNRLNNGTSDKEKKRLNRKLASLELANDYPDPLDVMKFQLKVATDQLPYWHSKQAGSEDIPDNVQPVMVIGNMNLQQVNNNGLMSAGVDPNNKTVEIQTVSKGENSAPSE
ncbi:MAG: hypothetical protein AAF478_03545 [Pseudomonadota bacterium]